MPLDATGEQQLLQITPRGRGLVTFNISDLVKLNKRFPDHAGIVLANQRQWTPASLIAALDLLLNQTSDESWRGQIRWLNEWRYQS
jgi:hypothetical protein